MLHCDLDLAHMKKRTRAHVWKWPVCWAIKIQLDLRTIGTLIKLCSELGNWDFELRFTDMALLLWTGDDSQLPTEPLTFTQTLINILL